MSTLRGPGLLVSIMCCVTGLVFFVVGLSLLSAQRIVAIALIIAGGLLIVRYGLSVIKELQRTGQVTKSRRRMIEVTGVVERSGESQERWEDDEDDGENTLLPAQSVQLSGYFVTQSGQRRTFTMERVKLAPGERVPGAVTVRYDPEAEGSYELEYTNIEGTKQIEAAYKL